jgi:NAD-dependent dihydropyrimidine dehydrogenase PreA subunit
LVKRKIIEINEKKCNGCGLCIPNCAEGALKIIDGKARIIDDKYCDGLGACLGHCPQDALNIIVREAPDFNEEAVHEHLKTIRNEQTMGCGSLTTLIESESNPEIKSSALHQWPVQLNLVPIKAPFWNNADLLLLADCVAVAQPDLHNKLLSGRSVMVGCPKLDNVKHYVNKLTNILEHNPVLSLTIAIMEVPCCSGLRNIAKLALENSSKKIPMQNFVISVDGKISQT